MSLIDVTAGLITADARLVGYGDSDWAFVRIRSHSRNFKVLTGLRNFLINKGSSTPLHHTRAVSNSPWYRTQTATCISTPAIFEGSPSAPVVF